MARGGDFPPVRKSLGQHFLSDRRILSRIVDALDPAPDETVIEIGPGRGSLTEILRPRVGRLIAIEYDRALADKLRRQYQGDAGMEIVESDVLEVDYGALAQGQFAVVGNVPYYITTPILFKGLEQPRPTRALYLVQLEVAQRLVASPGGREYGALTVNAGALARVELLFRVPAGAFSPPPKVESAVVKVQSLSEPLVRAEEERRFQTFVRRCFGMRRKQMRRVLRSALAVSATEAEAFLAAAGIEPEVRPETLAPSQFVALLRALPGSVAIREGE